MLKNIAVLSISENMDELPAKYKDFCLDHKVANIICHYVADLDDTYVYCSPRPILIDFKLINIEIQFDDYDLVQLVEKAEDTILFEWGYDDMLGVCVDDMERFGKVQKFVLTDDDDIPNLDSWELVDFVKDKLNLC